MIGYMSAIVVTIAILITVLTTTIAVTVVMVTVDTGEVMRQCKKEIPTFSGVKFSCRELANYEMASMESEGGRYKLALGAVDDVSYLPSRRSVTESGSASDCDISIGVPSLADTGCQGSHLLLVYGYHPR